MRARYRLGNSIRLRFEASVEPIVSDYFWATDSTEKILTLLADKDVALSQRGILLNLKRAGESLSRSTIKDHVRLALADGLVETIDDKDNWYVVTDAGREYLESRRDSNKA